MSDPARDRWAQWLLERRFGGDPEHRDSFLEGVTTWRDRVLGNATVREGETLLDVGAGAFLPGAKDRVGPATTFHLRITSGAVQADVQGMIPVRRGVVSLQNEHGAAQPDARYPAELLRFHGNPRSDHTPGPVLPARQPEGS